MILAVVCDPFVVPDLAQLCVELVKVGKEGEVTVICGSLFIVDSEMCQREMITGMREDDGRRFTMERVLTGQWRFLIMERISASSPNLCSFSESAATRAAAAVAAASAHQGLAT